MNKKTADNGMEIRKIEQVNERVRLDPRAFIEEQEALYARQVENAASVILRQTSGRRLIMQCGPSSVGKTTTAQKITAHLKRHGVEAHTVSLDNFYRGLGFAPCLEDGSYDYESPQALDLPLLRQCMTELLYDGHTLLPEYDFQSGCPKAERQELSLSRDAAVIFEGVHAFEPSLYAALDVPHGAVTRIFVNTCSRFVQDGEVVLSRRDIRLARRMLRDERFRASSFENTLQMWQQVMRGEIAYIFPYRHTADAEVDTTIGYEPCVLAPRLLPRLAELHDTPYRETALRLEQALGKFAPVEESQVPPDSVLREFLG